MTSLFRRQKNKKKQKDPNRQRGKYLHLFIEYIQIEKSRQYKQLQISIQDETKIILGSFSNTSNTKKMHQINQTFLFEANEKDVLKFILRPKRNIKAVQGSPSQLKQNDFRQQSSRKQRQIQPEAYCELPIKKLYRIPRVRHCIEADLGCQLQEGGQKIGIISLQILILHENIGTLQLTTIQAQLSKDTQFFGKMDPYLVLKINKQQYKTSVKDEAGTNPIWNTKFIIPIKDISVVMEVLVYDKDIGNDDLIGSAKIDLFENDFLYPSKKFQTLKVIIDEEITKNKKSPMIPNNVGQVLISYRFILNQM